MSKPAAPLSRIRRGYRRRFKHELEPATIMLHEYALDRMIEFWGPDKTMRELVYADASAFHKWVSEGRAASTTDKIMRNAVSVYGRVRPKARRNVFGKVRLTRFENHPPPDVSADDFEKILAACPTTRHQLVFHLARSACLRAGEIYGLMPEHFQLSETGTEKYWQLKIVPPTSKVGGKKRFRLVPIFPWLADLIEQDRRFWMPGKPIFTKGFRADRHDKGRVIDKIVTESGVVYKAPLHGLRACGIRDMCRIFQDLGRVSLIVGCSPAVILRHYFPITPAEVKQVLAVTRQ